MKTCLITLAFLLCFFATEAQLPWKLVDVTANYGENSLASTNNGYVFVSRNGMLYRSTQNGDSGTFNRLTTAPAVANNAQVYAYGDDLYLLSIPSTNSQGVWRSPDYGVTWTQSKNGFSTAELKKAKGIAFIDSGCIIILVSDGQNPNNYYVSKDYGATWSLRLSIPGYGPECVNIVRRNKKLYLFQHYKTYTSADNGMSWSGPSGGYYPAAQFHKTVVLSDGTFIMKTGNLVMSSTDSGATWKQVVTSGLSTNATTANFVKSPNSDRLYLTVSGGQAAGLEVYMSGDKGATWNKFETGLPAILDAGPWMLYAQQLHISNNGYLFLAPDMFVAGTDDVGLYRTTSRVTKPFKVPLRQKDTSTQVSTFAGTMQIADVYPNPARDMINISFPQNKPGTASVIINNICGQTIAKTMLQHEIGYRTHSLDIRTLPVGVYIIHLSTPDGNAVQKFVKE